ncbi:hypothetical protein NXX53_20300 [Bacteroides salyersiae]|nr:hypothetical protein [Bacteroides salyersiae]MCS2403619.1 hypothetical protein [Bacteroides salyersiae]MCS2958704.1 hypothetical protein [Bacteroides salyersiae]WMS08390.1 hypothetical protein RB604_11760 [Bacteroides salyersiae]
MRHKNIYLSIFTLMALFCSCGTEENAPETSGNGGNDSDEDTKN